VKERQSGRPQGGILSPLLANIVLSVLHDHLTASWKPGCVMTTEMRRRRCVWKGLPVWRVVRYADELVVMTRGRPEAERRGAARRDRPGAPTCGCEALGSQDQGGDMEEGFDFLGFHIRWSRKRGTEKWYVYTFVAGRPFRRLQRSPGR
jgi:RNA-directed DNA polymerase